MREFASRLADFAAGSLGAALGTTLAPGTIGNFPGRVFIRCTNLVRVLRKSRCSVTKQQGLETFLGAHCASLLYAVKQ
jgi:hypothetical protein